MGSLLGFRPPQFSEDAAWLPAWLQQPHFEPLDEHIREVQTPLEQLIEELPFFQQNISTGEDAHLSSRDEGGYKSFHLFLSGEENSPVSFAPSSGNMVHFHLHLSVDSNSENMQSPLLNTSQSQRFESNHAMLMQSLETSVVPEENANHFKVDYNACVLNLPPAPQQEKSKNFSPQSVTSNKDKGMKNEENVRFPRVTDINDAVELSIAASEALVIHEIIKSESSTKSLPASAVLEVALQVKQARLEGLKETLHCSTEEISEIDFLSDLDESTMENAYEDVGLSVSGPGDLHGCDSIISQVNDTLASENYRSDDILNYEELGAPEVDCGDISTKQQLEDVLDVDKQLKKDLALESFDGDRQKKLDLDVTCHVNPMLHCSVQANPDVSATIEEVEFAMATFQETVNSSPWARSSDSAEIADKLTNLVPDRFQSRWLGGWTWKKDASAPVEQNNAKSIPEFFVGETSFFSESADVAPDENSFVQRQDKGSNVASQFSIPFEDLCNKANDGILLSLDIMRSSSPSFVDPLCSVVPCSISSENACSTPTLKHNDKVEAEKCFCPTPDHGLDNLQRTTLNVEFVYGEGLAVPVTNGEGCQPTVRRQLTSLRSYSMLLPSHGTLLEKGSIYSDQSFRLESNVRLLSSAMQNPVTDLTNEKRNYDETAKDGAELLVRMQKSSSPLILNRGTRRRFKASKCVLHDFDGEENQEGTAVPESDLELPQSKNLQKAQSRCKSSHDAQVPARKRVRFSETEINLLQKKKLQKLQTTYRNCSTRTGKRLKCSNPHFESRAQEVKRCLTYCRGKDGKRMLFQNIEFLLTGFSSQKEKEIEGLIRKYGGMVLSDIPSPPNSRGKRSSRFNCQPFPVIVCSKKLQTTKFLYGCAVNACMLKVDWLTDSTVAGSVLPPDKYMILPNHFGGMCTRIGKPVHRNNHPYIFDSVGIMLHGTHNFCTKMAKVVKHGGGKVFKTLQWLVQSLDAEKISVGVIVAEDEIRASRHLKHCALEWKIPMMSASWIIKSLHVGKLLPFMENNHSSPLPPIKLLDCPVSMELSEEI